MPATFLTETESRLSHLIRTTHGADDLRLLIETYAGTISQSSVLARLALEKLLPYVVPPKVASIRDLVGHETQRPII